MKKYFWLFMVVASNLQLYGQHQAPNFTLNKQLYGKQEYQASQYIDMIDGFGYKATSKSDVFHAKIDPFMVFPPEEGEVGGPIGAGGIVGEDGVVGATKGSLSVNDAGSAVYQIPLEFPGGISGMTPELSLVYNSSGPDGILGPGWSLGGLSVITCVPATRYHNGIRQAAFGNDYEDGAYALDGQRLVPVQYEDGINFREYRTEMDVFSKIMRKANTKGDRDEDGKYFEVMTKSGLTYIYGKTSDSRHTFRQTTNSASYTVSYYVSSISDNMGNRITFEYNNDWANGDITIKSIKYTILDNGSSNGTAPIYSIDFFYKNRPDVLTHYLSYKTGSATVSVKTSTSKVIETISCAHISSNAIVKEYKLDYLLRGPGNDGTKKTLHLNSVQEFGKNREEKYNKTVFEWEDEMNFSFTETQGNLPETFFTKTGPGRFISKPKYHLNDFNNDNKTDILRVYSVFDNIVGSPDYFVVLEYLQKTADGSWRITNYNKIQGLTFQQITNDDFYIVLGDFNGDAFCDIIFSYNKWEWEEINNEWVKHHKGTLIKHFENNNNFNFSENQLFNNNTQVAFVYPGDFNGDGIRDLMMVNKTLEQTSFKFGNSINPLQSNIDKGLIYPILTNTFIDQRIEIEDINGDGRDEIVQKPGYTNTRVVNFLEPESDNSNLIIRKSETLNIPSGLLSCSLNKDRKTDYLWVNPTANIYQPNESFKVSFIIQTSTTAGTVILETKNQAFNYIYEIEEPLDPWRNFEIANIHQGIERCDLNADGMTDLVLLTFVSLKFNVGDGTFFNQNYSYTNIYIRSNDGKFLEIENDGQFLIDNKHTVFDIDFNNQSDFIYIGEDAYEINAIKIYSPDYHGSRISSITNGLGHKTTIEYAFIGDPDVYTPGAEVEYPIVPYEAQRCVVKKVNRSNGQGGFFTEQYKYEKARAHTEGLGFIGFEKITRTDVTRGIEYITEYGLDNEFFVSYPTKQTTKLLGGPVIEQTINIYITQSTTSGIANYSGNKKYYFVRPDESETFNYELNTDETSSFVYKRTLINYSAFDDYGNPGTITTTSQDMTVQNAPVYKKTTSHVYDPADIRNDFQNHKYYWILGRLTESSTKFESPGTDAITKKSGFGYYQATEGKKYGMLKEEKDYKYNSNTVLTTKTYTYDAFGNIASSQIEATGLQKIVNGTYYTPDGRFLEELINPMEHKTTRQYEPLLANLLFETDFDNNLTTEFRYDGFGRLEKGIAPDGIISASVMRWAAPEDSDKPDFAVYYTWQQTSGKSPVKVYYNSLGMELRSVTYGFKEMKVYVDTYYDEKGRLWQKSLPYDYEQETPRYSKNTYDLIGRVKTTTVPDEGSYAVTRNTYNGFTISTKNALNQENSKTLNAAGWTVKSTDDNGNSVLHEYYADGAVKSTKVEAYEKTGRNYKYDNAGNLEEYNDASQGTLKYVYDAYGQLNSETNANNQVTTYDEYDLLGRLLSKTAPEGIFTYRYDQQKKGMPDFVDGPGNHISYTYDKYLRPLTQSEIIDNGETFVTTYEYDELGRLHHLTYPSGYKIRNTYTYNGYPLAIVDTEDNKKLWEANSMNARGQYTNVNIGEIQQTFDYYENSGRIWKIKANGLQNNEYIWDKGGNLRYRSTRVGKVEGFVYDDLNRLKRIYHNGTTSFLYNYDDLGNIIHKSDVGDYTYGNNDNPYELTSINNKPVTINNYNQVIDYNSFNKVYKITEKHPETFETKRQLDLLYGVDNSRVKQTITENGNETSSKLYIGGSYEIETKDGETSFIHYINAPTGLVAIVTKKGINKETEFVLNDHLGSLQILATRTGGLIEEFSYDAWGMRRDPITFAVFAVVPANGTSYGFTGHEHIDLFLLVNMDGRMYDPVLGRFLSPDPVLQFPNYTQGLNPYAYALNNPLRFVDPTGYSLIGQLAALTASVALSFIPGVNFLVPILVYSVVMTVDHAIEIGRTANFGNVYGYFVHSFVMGIISTGVTKGIGDYYDFAKTGKFSNEFKRAVAHGTFNGAMRLAQGGKFEHGFLSGFVSSLGGSFMQSGGVNMSGAGKIVVSAAIGGTAEALGGGKFSNGAVTGAYVMMLNHLGEHGGGKRRVVDLRKNYKEDAITMDLGSIPNVGNLYKEGLPVEIRLEDDILIVLKENNIYVSIKDISIINKINDLMYGGEEPYRPISVESGIHISSILRAIADPIPNPLDWGRIYAEHSKILTYNTYFNRLDLLKRLGIIY